MSVDTFDVWLVTPCDLHFQFIPVQYILFIVLQPKHLECRVQSVNCRDQSVSQSTCQFIYCYLLRWVTTHGMPPCHLTIHSGQLSLLPSAGWEMRGSGCSWEGTIDLALHCRVSSTFSGLKKGDEY